MVEINSMREFHTQLCVILSSLESLTHLAAPDHEEVAYAVQPALDRFRDLLDAGDKIAGPD